MVSYDSVCAPPLQRSLFESIAELDDGEVFHNQNQCRIRVSAGTINSAVVRGMFDQKIGLGWTRNTARVTVTGPRAIIDAFRDYMKELDSAYSASSPAMREGGQPLPSSTAARL